MREAPAFRLSEDADVDLTRINVVRHATETCITSTRMGGGSSLLADSRNQLRKKRSFFFRNGVIMMMFNTLKLSFTSRLRMWLLHSDLVRSSGLLVCTSGDVTPHCTALMTEFYFKCVYRLIRTGLTHSTGRNYHYLSRGNPFFPPFPFCSFQIGLSASFAWFCVAQPRYRLSGRTLRVSGCATQWQEF